MNKEVDLFIGQFRESLVKEAVRLTREKVRAHPDSRVGYNAAIYTLQAISEALGDAARAVEGGKS